ncbi:MAG: dihydroorotase, partial [archaeon]|nr:dihydroorotase [archaeon]
MSLCIFGAEVYEKNRLVKKNILIKSGKIIAITKSRIKANEYLDARGKIILPAAIDVHVHFREPGFTEKEDWFSGSLAAIHGGIATVMEMPNTNPPTDSISRFAEKKVLAKKKSLVDFDLYMAATETNLGEIEKAKGLRAVKLYYGSTTGNILFNKREKILELFALAKKKGIIVVVHAEDEQTIRANAKKFAGNASPNVHAKIRSEEAEAIAISELLELQKKAGNKLHIAHISSAKGLALVKGTKKGENKNLVTCEVTPNHLFLDSTSYKRLGNLMKCNPSIKEKKNRSALWRAFKGGEIDICATDHAPHTQKEKQLPYEKCPSGIPGVETMYPLLL